MRLRCTALRSSWMCAGVVLVFLVVVVACSSWKPEASRPCDATVPSAPSVEPKTEAQPKQDQVERKAESDRAEEIRREIAVIDARIEHLGLEVHQRRLTPPIDDGNRLVDLGEAEEALKALERDPAKAEEAAAFRGGLKKELARFEEWMAKEKRRSEEAKPYTDEMVKLAQEKVILEHELKGLDGKVGTERSAGVGSESSDP